MTVYNDARFLHCQYPFVVQIDSVAFKSVVSFKCWWKNIVMEEKPASSIDPEDMRFNHKNE
jgi:hypothetical protein